MHSPASHRALRSLLAVALVALALPLLAGAPIPVAANSFSVTTTADAGPGSLRQAITEANLNPDADLIAITVPGVYKLISSTLTITNDVTITNTSGGAVTIDGNCTGCDPGGTPSGGTQVFTITGGAVSISGVTISHGHAGGESRGGAIFLDNGTLTLTNTTISNNAANTFGGGIYINGGTLTATNTTIADNIAGFSGGGIYINEGGTLIATNVTIAGNTTAGGLSQGGIFNLGTANLTNTIVAGDPNPSDSDVGGAFTSGGHNLIGKTDSSGGWVPSDKTGTVAAPLDPRLAPLGAYGGPTPTMPPLSGSPAIDAGDNAAIKNPPFPGPPFTDQRGTGFPRIINSTVDIGAFEGSVSLGGGGGNPNCATLTASPNPVPFGTGTTDLAWNTCDGSPAEVTIANNGGPETDFVTSGPPVGHQLTTTPTGQGFIVSGSYIVRLYRADSHTLLAGVIVTKLNPKGTTGPAITATPSLAPFTPGQVLNQVLIKFDSGDDSPADVYVSLNGGTPALFTENVVSPGGAGAAGTTSAKAGVKPATATPTGERADWVQSGTYTFTLKSHASGATLDSATVTTQGVLAATPNPVSGGSNLTGTSTQLTFNTGSGLPGAVCVANASNVYVPNTLSNSGAGISTLNALTTGTYTAQLYISASGANIGTVLPGIGGCTANVPLTPAPGIAPLTITVNP
jgi:hypothetical protein